MATMMNKLVSNYLHKWDRELEFIKKDCPKAQENELHKILNSRLFQYMHGQIARKEFEDLPITKYEDYNSKVIQLMEGHSIACAYYAQSSGTSSNKKKLVPTPEEFVKCNHLRGSWYLLHTMYQHNPNMSVFTSKNLLVGGSIYKRTARYKVGDISGIMLNRIPYYMRPWYVPNIPIAVQPDWERKIEQTVEAATNTMNISLLGGAPTWVLAVIKRCLKRSGAETIAEMWPNLQAYIHGGVNFEPYRNQFNQLLGETNCRLIEVYNATEGFFAYQDRPDQEGMLLMCSSGVCFEFIKLWDYQNDNYNIINISAVQKDEPYVILISTMSGLARYVQGDIITFVTVNPYRIKVIGRIQEFINAFGEDLYKAEVEQALSLILAKHRASVVDYTVAPRYLTIKDTGCHQWYMEFETLPKDMDQFARDLDQELQRRNGNYKQKRTADISMSNLEIICLPNGMFKQFMTQRGRINGQTKIPRLSNNRDFVRIIENLMSQKIPA